MPNWTGYDMISRSIYYLKDRRDGVSRNLDNLKAKLAEAERTAAALRQQCEEQQALLADFENALQLLQNSQGIVDKAGDA